MKKNHTELVFILDASGSMYGRERFVSDSFDNFIREEKTVPGTCNVSVVIFDYPHKIETPINSIPLETIGSIREIYNPNGTTALYDAIGTTIDNVGKRLKKMKVKDRPEKIMFIIITDGYENSSRKYTKSKISEMIHHQKEKYSWQFAFLGANQDSFLVAEQLNIDKEYTQNISVDSMESTQFAFATANSMSRSYRTGEFIN